jgi:putative flippase GtrA
MLKVNHMASILEKYLKQTNPFFRFILVGIVNTAIGLIVMFLLMNMLDVSYWISTFLGNSTGAVTSFVLNRTFTFKSNIDWRRGAVRFLFVILICYIAAYSLSQITANSLEWYFHLSLQNKHNLAVLIGTGFYMIFNYLGQKYFVFKRIGLNPIQGRAN